MDLGQILTYVIIGIVIAIIFNVFLKIILQNWVIIGKADRIAVIAKASGFKMIKVGSYGMCLPFVNKVSWISISAIVDEIRVENVISKGGTPVSMDAMVLYGIGAEEPENEQRVVGNAIRTSLGKNKEQISKQINEILEGNFRETIVGMTPEELINDKKQFNKRIMETSQDDLETIGFRLYDVKIKDIWDNKGYLKTLTKKGVQKITASMDILEKECDSEAAQQEAENNKAINVSTSNMNQEIIEKEKELETLRMEKNGKLEEAEKLATQKIEKATAIGNAKIEKANIEVQKIVQKIAISLPAEINKRTEEIAAEGEAESVRTIGEAKNKILDLKLKTLSSYGKEGLIPFMITKLKLISDSFNKSLERVKIDKITVLGAKGGDSGFSQAANLGPSAFLKHLKNIDEAFGLKTKDIIAKVKEGK